MALGVAFATFGCKLNQLETESLADAFRQAGARVLGPEAAAEADLVLVNTCAVTAKAEARGRRGIRLALTTGPEATILVTGCAAELGRRALEALDPRVRVVRGSDKDVLLGLPAQLSARLAAGEGLPGAVDAWLEGLVPGRERDAFAFTPSRFTFHSRPSLKVEDGCDHRCTYCAVSLARGPARSLDPGLALERLQELEGRGAREVVLTGVNLSHYRARGLDFPGLLRHLLAGTHQVGLRLSSWEPDRVDAAFLEAFSEPRVRPHLHLALQSGSDALLAAMGRRYTARMALEALSALREVREDPFLSADLILGFPGEGEAEFRQTLDFLAAADLAWIHGFAFSPRPGTPAASLGNPVAERVAGERVLVVGGRAETGRKAYARRWQGREVGAIVEGLHARRPGAEPWVRATSENYLRLGLASGGGWPPGAQVRCRLGPSPDPVRYDAGAQVPLAD